MMSLGIRLCCKNTQAVVLLKSVFALPPNQFPLFIKRLHCQRVGNWVCVFVCVVNPCGLGVSN